MNRFLSSETARHLLLHLRHSGFPLVYDQEKHRVLVTDAAGNELMVFRLPLVLPYTAGQPAPPAPGMHYIVLLIQAGSCAIGYFENGINLDHKVFRAYMVRKKQGTSQIKYLKTKGKSRAGSRVRLAETNEFFDNINERLQEYFAAHPIDRIALSCSKTLLPYLYSAKVATPFDKRDPRILKIPRHIHTPIYEVLLDTHKFLLKGELIYEESQQPLVDQWLNGLMA
jgi:hypothetical protein